MSETTGRRKRHTRQQIMQLLASFANQACTAGQFCAANNIMQATFAKWRSRYGIADKRQKISPHFNTFYGEPIAPPTGLFAEVNGIKLYQPVGPDYLKQLAAP